MVRRLLPALTISFGLHAGLWGLSFIAPGMGERPVPSGAIEFEVLEGPTGAEVRLEHGSGVDESAPTGAGLPGGDDRPSKASPSPGLDSGGKAPTSLSGGVLNEPAGAQGPAAVGQSSTAAPTAAAGSPDAILKEDSPAPPRGPSVAETEAAPDGRTEADSGADPEDAQEGEHGKQQAAPASVAPGALASEAGPLGGAIEKAPSAPGEGTAPGPGSGGFGPNHGKAGPPGSTGGGAVGARAPESGALLAHLRSHARRCYPRSASRRGTTGTVDVSFCVTSAGNSEKEQVIRTSGSRLLDQAAINCVIRGSVPLPAPPACYSLPVRFYAQ